jgi:hypothetical protein
MWRAVGITALVALGVGSIRGLNHVMTQPVGQASQGDFFSALFLSLGVRVQEGVELPRAVDVVVCVDAEGALEVSGRAVAKPLRLASVADLKSVLQALPRPGTGFVGVSSPGSDRRGSGGLQPVEASLVIEQVRAALREAGFAEARSGNKRFF